MFCAKNQESLKALKMNTSPINKSPLATNVWFDDSKMFVRLEDGRELAVPLA